MALDRYEIILGNSLELSLPAGHELRADWSMGGVTDTATVTSANGAVVFAPSAIGNYYLATRTAAAEPWCRIGTLEVVALVDQTYEGMLAELAALNTQIADSAAAFTQFQESDPSGTAVTRMTYNRMLEARAKLEARVANYERAAQGLSPVRWS